MESERRLRQRRANPLRLTQPLHPETAATVSERRARNIANLEAKLGDPTISSSFTERQLIRRMEKLRELKLVDASHYPGEV